MIPADRRTLVDVLRERTRAGGDDLAYEYVEDDGRVSSLTYGQLSARAAGVAEQLRSRGHGAGPVVLLHRPGLEFVVTLWGCLLLGVPAVPAYPPLAGPSSRVLDRLERIVSDSGARCVVADELSVTLMRALVPEDGDGPDILALDTTAPVADPDGTECRPEDVALIQYTSGSTGHPKGVVLEHRNLVANMHAISDVLGLDTSTRAISWLPPYHDMGLIGFILTPVFGGFPVRLMSPVDFLRNPLGWLRQISETGATHTGGPDFAYDLCVRRARDEDLADVDLRTWRVAFDGAEPIRPRTLHAFAGRFRALGFRAEAFLPCYGLAEATLIVTGRGWSDDAVDGDGRVDCGPVVAGHDLRIVDPATGAEAGPRAEGEIWVSGPSVGPGYWNASPDPDEPPARGTLDGRSFLRTGDSGYLRDDGGLVVTGRLKDVVVQHGVNHHAHDIEAAAVTDNPAVRPTAAAFAVDGPGVPDGADHERTVLAVETAERDPEAPERVAADLRARVAAASGARLDVVVLCRPRSIPRTTSGKIQRRLARSRYLSGELGGAAVTAAGAGAEEPADVPTGGSIEVFLAAVFAGVCEVDDCAPTTSLLAIGGDSVRAAEIAAITEETLALPVPVERVLDAQTPVALREQLLRLWADDGVTEADVLGRLGALAGAADATA